VLCSAASAENSNLNGLALGAGTSAAATCLTVSKIPSCRPIRNPGCLRHPGVWRDTPSHSRRLVRGENRQTRRGRGEAEARHFEARHFEARHFEARHFEARHFEARHFEARRGGLARGKSGKRGVLRRGVSRRISTMGKIGTPGRFEAVGAGHTAVPRLNVSENPALSPGSETPE